ncbi:MAG: YHS domain-containing protein [Candidatus Omnitrophica bacterium]|nr:YHS domain-containing protein [Candidatus Omnitrophota bacterium]
MKDPICKMKVDTTKAIKFTQDGFTYYFCSENCR